MIAIESRPIINSDPDPRRLIDLRFNPRCASRLVLASASPRRAELLAAAGIRVRRRSGRRRRVAPQAAKRRSAYVERVARLKASAGAAPPPAASRRRAPTRWSCSGDDVLGKPRDEADARDMLRQSERPLARGADGVAVASRPRASKRSASQASGRTWSGRRSGSGRCRTAKSRGTSGSASPWTRPAPTRFRAWRRGSSRESMVRTRTWSGCRWPPLADLVERQLIQPASGPYPDR